MMSKSQRSRWCSRRIVVAEVTMELCTTEMEAWQWRSVAGGGGLNGIGSNPSRGVSIARFRGRRFFSYRVSPS
ncbi:hypothetical protein A2U01_0029372 [Trifolium medium]|uniref:Uncharacterized protein n=1 Tax=Trifolium medium TaxID=97028 RepID=A0A392PAI9_9FABA|nr:hypothetical protein [Trifolium medium]